MRQPEGAYPRNFDFHQDILSAKQGISVISEPKIQAGVPPAHIAVKGNPKIRIAASFIADPVIGDPHLRLRLPAFLKPGNLPSNLPEILSRQMSGKERLHAAYIG